MHLLITGSRSINYLAVKIVLDGLHAKYPISKLTHGNAKGVDIAAAQWARQRSFCNEPAIEQIAYPADWKQHGKRAGLVRNEEMLATCPALDCGYLAIWDGNSTGTAHMVNLMRERSAFCEDEHGFIETMPWHNWRGLRIAYRIPNKTA